MFNRTCDPPIAFPVNRKRCTHLPLANNNMYAPSKPDQEIAPNYAIRNTDPLHTLFNRMHEKHISLPVNKEWNSQTPSAYHTMYAPTHSNCYLRKRTRYARLIRNTASYKNTTNRPECKKHKLPKCLRISENTKITKHTATSLKPKCSRTNAAKRICAKIIYITQNTMTPQGANVIQTFKCSCTHPNAHPAKMMSQREYKINAYIRDLTSLRPYIAKLTNHRHNCSPVICAITCNQLPICVLAKRFPTRNDTQLIKHTNHASSLHDTICTSPQLHRLTTNAHANALKGDEKGITTHRPTSHKGPFTSPQIRFEPINTASCKTPGNDLESSNHHDQLKRHNTFPSNTNDTPPHNRNRNNHNNHIKTDDKDWACDLCANESTEINHTIDDSRCVLNLSNYTLSDGELSLLSHGLNFCPTPTKEPNMGAISQDLKNFHIKIQRESFFHENNNDSLNLSRAHSQYTQQTQGFKHYTFKKRSTWVPAPNTNVAAFIACNERDLNDHTTPPRGNNNNISRLEQMAIGTLKSNQKIVIKPADKGSAIVILNRTDYIAEGERQLTDDKYYQPLEHCPSETNHQKICKTLDTMVLKKELSNECLEFLLDFKPRTPEFYMLPKIHKNQTPPPGRPIISGNDSPTERISQLVDHFLQPCVPKLTSYVKDSTHFLQIIEPYTILLPTNTLLCTLDVSSLYTNIPHEEGIRACAEALRNEPTRDISVQSILTLIRLILTTSHSTKKTTYKSPVQQSEHAWPLAMLTYSWECSNAAMCILIHYNHLYG